MIRQTWAIFFDAYRELNAKRLFWFVLAISGIVVGAFAAIGLNETGITLLWWEFPSFITTDLFPPEFFYKWAFVTFGIKTWLTWAAAILALVSTAGLIPDFVASGSIELSLSKPIGRLRLFLTKYAAGLLFVALQVTVFTAACFLVIGIRGKSWEPGLFWAVPLTVLFFSYLYAVCAVIGLLTRSTIAALLLTMLVWLLIFGVHATEGTLMTLRLQSEMRAEQVQQWITLGEEKLAAQLAAGESGDAAAKSEATLTEQRLATNRDLLEKEQASVDSFRRWHRMFYAAKTGLPKTAETTALLERQLLSTADMQRFRDGSGDDASPMPSRDIPIDGREFRRRVEAEQRSRTVWWVVGTSVLFEALVLGLGAWIFCRRDF